MCWIGGYVLDVVGVVLEFLVLFNARSRHFLNRILYSNSKRTSIHILKPLTSLRPYFPLVRS